MKDKQSKINKKTATHPLGEKEKQKEGTLIAFQNFYAIPFSNRIFESASKYGTKFSRMDQKCQKCK